ncbi:hypothetical protein B0A55_12945 [Friedmanniomyces simplex]|uniref:Uncharacterized protein n=1 Tax=Friedmanniomyces simplex TaxID=329884 RepID=A0A4U0WQL6_9PEZI|nr:hypothetical protein B0A55_12945 [Friedmanniomyces simplex]
MHSHTSLRKTGNWSKSSSAAKSTTSQQFFQRQWNELQLWEQKLDFSHGELDRPTGQHKPRFWTLYDSTTRELRAKDREQL